MSKKEIPITKNQEYEVLIQDLASKGQGVGKVNNFTVFVPYTIPGETVKVKILKVKSSYAYGKAIEVINNSEERIEPKCDVFTKCGGCMMQHILYNKQLDYKRNIVKNALEKIGKVENINVNKVIGMENCYEYRNKIQLPVKKNYNEEINIGFYAPKSHRVIEPEKCYLQKRETDKLIKIIRNWIHENNISVYDEKTGKGLVRHIFIRMGFNTNELMLCLVINGTKLQNNKELVNRIIKEYDNIKSILLNINTKKTNVILGEKNILLWGRPFIYEKLKDYIFKISPNSFFQVNTLQAEKLYDEVVKMGDFKKDDIVYDLYCGTGTIALYISKYAGKVVGVEFVEDAVKDANKNKKLNNVNNVEFYKGNVEDVVPKLIKENVKANKIIVDPPRKGCDAKLLDTITCINPERIIYVSCNPSTLARDLDILISKGYKVKEVQPFDIFPHTPHVECVVGIQKVESTK